MASGVLILVGVALLDSGKELSELGLILLANLSDGKNRRGLEKFQLATSPKNFFFFFLDIVNTYLLVNNSSKTSLALDNSKRNTHLTAKSRKENDELNGVNVMGDQNKRSLLVLNQSNNVVKTVLDIVWLLANILLLLTIGNSSGLLVKTFLLLNLGFWAVFVEEFEGLGGSVAVQGVLELSDGRGNLETDAQDLLLALELDILGPLDETGQVTLGLDVLTNTEVTRASLDERVLYIFSID